MKMDISWMDDPEDHDYDAAEEYLSLTMPPPMAQLTAQALKDPKRGQRKTYKAKDILRASQLPLLPADDAHVRKAMEKVKAGKKLSPILLVRGKGIIIIADGYHRVCASYHHEDDTPVPCRIV